MSTLTISPFADMLPFTGTPMPEPGIYTDMSAEDYHAVAAHKGFEVAV